MSKVILGDCLEEMKKFPDNHFDLVLTDPPYGVTANDWDVVVDFMSEALRVAPLVIVFAQQPYASQLVVNNIRTFKYEWVWIKERGTGFARSKKQPMRRNENILVFYNKQPPYHYQGAKLDKPYRHALPINKSKSDNVAGSGYSEDGKRIYAEYTHKTKDNIIFMPRDNTRNGQHPTQKPVGLMSYLISTYTHELGSILDPFAGSGSTLVAAQSLNRNCIGIEINPDYVKIAQQRLKREVDKL